MRQLDSIERKLNTAKDLHSIVKTMKGLAAVSINQYEHAVDSITNYFETVEDGLQIVLKKEPHLVHLFEPQEDKTGRIVVIFGAGQPLCGSFNNVLATYFDSNWRAINTKKADDKIITAGHRITSDLEKLGWYTDHTFEMPTTVERINDTVQGLVITIQKWYMTDQYSEVHLFYNQPETKGSFRSVRQQLLPIDQDWLVGLSKKKWQGNSIPDFSMDAMAIISALIKQLLFVNLYKAFAESLSAENNSRLASMQLAEKKITETIEELTQAYRNQRQVSITEEILDIMASYEVLRTEEERLE